jgi:hypothetical protein
LETVMRDLTSRIPADVRVELERVASVLEPAVQAMRDLDRLRTSVELALDVPASLDPAELEPVDDLEFQHATRAVGLDRCEELLGELERAIPGLTLT